MLTKKSNECIIIDVRKINKRRIKNEIKIVETKNAIKGGVIR